MEKRVWIAAVAGERLGLVRTQLGVGAGGTTWLVAHSRAAADALAFDLARDRGALFGVERYRWRGLIAALAAPELAATGAVPASSVGIDALVARASYEASAAELGALERIQRTPGFTRALGRTLRQLRAAGVAPERLEKLGAAGTPIQALYRAYMRQCHAAGLVDAVGLVEAARRALTDGRARPPSRLILLDVALRSRAEADFAVDLIDRSTSGCVVVPAGDETTLEFWRSAGAQLMQINPTTERPTLSRLADALFATGPAAPPPATPNGEVRFLSAPGEARECAEIARVILTESRGGIRFDQMVVLVRSPAQYAAHLEAAFRRGGIPAHFARGVRRPDVSGRAFLALLACAEQGLSARCFAEYLSFAQVPASPPADALPGEQLSLPLWEPPEDVALGHEPTAQTGEAEDETEPPFDAASPVASGSLRAPWRWESLLVEAAVIGGYQRWERRLAGLEAELRLRLEELSDLEPEAPRIQAIERTAVELGHLQRFALPVIRALDALPKVAPWGDWLDAWRRLLPRVLRRPERVMALLADMQPMAAIPSVTISEVREVLAERLERLEHLTEQPRSGAVWVGHPDDIRGQTARLVIVPGLAERIFPERPREDPLLLDEARAALESSLATQRKRVLAERLLLRLAVGAARERLILTYPRVEMVQARPRVPSFYALDVARATSGALPDFRALEAEARRLGDTRLAWPAPRCPENAIDALEHDLASLAELFELPLEESRGGARYLFDLNPYLARGLRQRWQRWAPKWYAADGALAPGARTAPHLKQLRLTRRAYSVTALEKFASCPLRFVLAAVHRLSPREEAVALVEMDPLTRGRLIHEVQAAALAALRAAGALPIGESHVDQARRVLQMVFEEITARYYDDLAPAIDRVWFDEVARVRKDLDVWLESLRRDAATWTPTHFELGFGLPPHPSRDPASGTDPVSLGDGWLVRGVVDMVERDTAGRLRVTDYKTGRYALPRDAHLAGGKVLQPVLYSLALEQLLQAETLESRLYFCTARGGFAEHNVSLSELTRHDAMQVLRTVDEAIAGGRLMAYPDKGACRFCDYRSACGPAEEARVARKPRLMEIDRMRRFQ